MVRFLSQFGSLMLLALLLIIAPLPSHAHGLESHRPKKEIRVLDETTFQDSDEKMSDENANQEAMIENNVMREVKLNVSGTPAIADESKSSPPPTPVEAAGIMPQGLGETLAILLVAVPAGLYALKYRG